MIGSESLLLFIQYVEFGDIFHASIKNEYILKKTLTIQKLYTEYINFSPATRSLNKTAPIKTICLILFLMFYGNEYNDQSLQYFVFHHDSVSSTSCRILQLTVCIYQALFVFLKLQWVKNTRTSKQN